MVVYFLKTKIKYIYDILKGTDYETGRYRYYKKDAVHFEHAGGPEQGCTVQRWYRIYRSPAEPKPGEVVVIRFRTQRNNVDAVYLVSGDKKQKMKIYKTVNGFDYYAAKIIMPEEVFKYHFEILYGWITCYYNHQGVSMDMQEWFDFEIYPNYDTPDWAKGAVMYQIFVDRFYNGDPTNDVETGEYAYIGDISIRVKDWNKTPL